MCRVCVVMIAVAAAALVCLGAAAQPTTTRIEDLPVREVTIFKNGLAFIAHEGALPVRDGAVMFEYLPEPVLGTFWAHVRGRRASLTSVVAGTQDVAEGRTAISLAELLRANAGKSVTLFVRLGGDTKEINGTLIGVPEREVERETVAPARYEYDYRLQRQVQIPASAQVETVEERGDIVLVRSGEELHAYPLASVASVSFAESAATEFAETVEKRRLRLNISGGRGQTTVGLTYLQRGLRWIPEYTVTIDDEGQAWLRLQGTIINDMIDLDDVTTYLVVGVPSFVFEDQISPLALRKAAAQLSEYFGRTSGASTNFFFSNAIMGQTLGDRAELAGAAQPFEPTAEALGPQEDLFLYKVEHISLRKGERMIVPVIEVKATYTDAYIWQVPFSPPPELLSNLNNQDRELLLRMSSGQRVRHTLRLTNESEVPWTTGPAMIVKDGCVLAQSLLRYTSVGNEVDVDVTVATDVHTKKWEKQTAREDNAKTIGSHSYTRLDMRGFLELTNYKDEAVTVEITRAVLGSVTTADNDGEISQLNSFEDWSFLPEGSASVSGGWYWYWWRRWPWWWHQVNDIGQITWEITLEPGEKRQLQYEWYYYAR
jgi:hypothetical protein